MAKRSAFGTHKYVIRKKVKRRHKKHPLNYRKKLTPSQSRIKKNGRA
tara:strand:- start:1588 stop:1728 length:141 start_codon:yes stop_codon:yes gene_type:complete